MLNNLAGGCKDLPAEIRDLLKGFNPYKGGNDTLWAMNELCNAPKHKMLYPVVIAGGGVGLGVGDGGVAVIGHLEIAAKKWDSEKNEMEVARFPEGGLQGNPKLDIGFSITLDDVDKVIRGQNPVAVLRTMVGEVERILAATEREYRRIGLVK
jgi:hypothetical protein